MPNWCSNKLTLTHEDPKMITRAVEAFICERLLSEFAPLSNDTVDEARSGWGTKWDVGGTADDIIEGGDLGDTEVTFMFDSAWAPPVNAYAKFEEQGFEVIAYYWEPGQQFCGEYTDGVNSYFEIEGDSNWVRENIPECIIDEFDMVEQMEYYEVEDE